MKELRGTTAIVTGASRGIGVYIARALADEGVNLSLTARSADELEKVRSEIESMGVKAIATVGDVSIAEDRARLIERTETELGPIDILINNAAIDIVRRFHEAPESDFVDTLRINLEAPILLTRAIVPGMLERDRGHVVNISSGGGKVGVPGEAAYCSSKHGLVGFTNALRSEYERNNVNFSVVCPGLVSDVGMAHRWVEGGVKAPLIAGNSKPQKVAAVVVSCIKKNRAEVLVNTPPIRPLIVLANIAPGITPYLLRKLGYSGTFERIMDKGMT